MTDNMKKIALFWAVMILISGSVLYLSTPSHGDSDVEFSIDFDSGGGLQLIERNGNHFTFDVVDDNDGETRDYFHLRFENVKDETITIDFQNINCAPSDWSPWVNYGSLTDLEWEQIDTTLGDFEYTFNEDEAYISSRWAYSNSAIYERQVKHYAENYETADYEIIGQSLNGRDQYALTVEDPEAEDNKEIVIYARQHSQEVKGSVRLDGQLEWLVPRVEYGGFEENYSFHILPNMNPDGIYEALNRHDSEGNDLNRKWDESEDETPPEVLNAQDYISENIENPHFGFDLHSARSDFYAVMVIEDVPSETELDWMDQMDENIITLDGTTLTDYENSLERSRGYFYEETGGTMFTTEQHEYIYQEMSEVKDIGEANLRVITEYDEDFEEPEDDEDDNGIWVPDDSEGVKDWIWSNLSLVVGTALIVGIAVMIDRELNG